MSSGNVKIAVGSRRVTGILRNIVLLVAMLSGGVVGMCLAIPALFLLGTICAGDHEYFTGQHKGTPLMVGMTVAYVMTAGGFFTPLLIVRAIERRRGRHG